MNELVSWIGGQVLGVISQLGTKESNVIDYILKLIFLNKKINYKIKHFEK